MKPTKIFLDLDDVLADFTMPALAKVGCPIDPKDLSQYPIECEFDIIKAADILSNSGLDFYDSRSLDFYDSRSFWNKLPREFWANLPKSKEADWLISVCVCLVGKDNVYILTAPTFPEDEVASAKVEWIHNFLPEWLADQYLIGKRKDSCASEKALLIDDSDRNVQEFRKAGGQAILWPRPWNSLDDMYNIPYTYLLDQMDIIFGPLYWMPYELRTTAA